MRRLITAIVAYALLAGAPLHQAQTKPAATAARNPAPAPPHAETSPDATQIALLFGPGFHPLSGFPVLTADLDGDGAEDAVAVATAEDPLLDEAAFQYKVVDPYSAAFGISDPRITRQFSVHQGPSQLVLVVHNWRAPKAKFVILNLPFDRLSLTRTALKKKTVPAIRAEELGGSRSIIYWDGKKWKWQDQGLSED
jgi:hypothetical protein